MICWRTRVERAGADKFLFGSDGPWLHPGVELAKVRALRLPANEEALVLGGNFLRLIRRVRRQPGASVEIRVRRKTNDDWADPWEAIPRAATRAEAGVPYR